MFGAGLLKGLGVTLKRFVETYVDDVKAIPSRYAYGQDIIRQTPDERGLFTIQYPDEKRALPERFRYIPMLIYDTPKGEDRCTACGICAKVCPPQCIWIVRDKDETGKPVPRPAEFYIDASICMSCGFCAEFCPFDAIKMNHDYELAVYQRYPNLVYNKAELTVPLEYYASLYPTQFAEEEKRRAEEEAKKAKKPGREKPAAAPAAPAKPAPAVAKPAAPAAPAAPAKPAAPAAATSGISQEELERRRAEALARHAARKAAAGEAAPVPAKPAAPAATSGISQEELERRRAEALARTAARKAAAGEAAPAPAAPPKPAPATKAPTPAKAPAPADVFSRLPNVAKTSGGYSVEEIAERRRAAYERYKARKGPDAKVLHAAAEAAPLPAVEAVAEAVAEAPAPAVEAPAPVSRPAPAAKPAAAAKAAAPGDVFSRLPNVAKTSGGYSVEEIAERRRAAYERYKARKGADAKDLTGH
ncbi:MAG: 4Fe-4S binding protein [Caldilineales bacterium]|nr:4Fe-4S binding protein [Caldilineales bacterium]MDW8317652.1 4Fe-4S binding protein [Anaerolineae bacterium]